MTDRSRLAVAALLLAGWAASGPARAQRGAAFDLITAPESAREHQATAPPEPPRTRSMSVPRAGVPVIRVLAPNTAAAVAAPLRIEIAFEAAPGARIVPASFRMLYGVLKIDLTERLRKHATVTEAGVVVDQAQVPDGVHRLFLQVADDKGNQAEHELRLRVGTTS